MTEFEIVGKYAEYIAPLYLHYSQQTGPQEAYVEISGDDETILATADAVIGGAVPFYVFNRRAKRIAIPATLRGEYVEKYLEEVKEITKEAVQGFRVQWNGRTNVGNWPGWTCEVDDALRELFRRYEDDDSANYVMYDASEWLCDQIPEIPAHLTDSELDAYESKIEEEALEKGIYLVNTGKLLRRMREESQQSQEIKDDD